MSGGIFPGRPFQFNIKCIIFTLIIAGGYWFLPNKKWYILLFLLWLPYVALAWYDYIYNCEDKLKPTVFPFGRWIFLPFKPKGYKDEFYKLPPEEIENMNYVDHLVGWSILIGILGVGTWWVLTKNKGRIFYKK
jgi:hypothetical protein